MSHIVSISPAAASKEDLLTMIQHGADTIFKEGNEGTIVDEDIEEILAKGEAKTAQLEDKFKDAGIDDLQRLTFNSTMVWEGEDYRGKVRWHCVSVVIIFFDAVFFFQTTEKSRSDWPQLDWTGQARAQE